MPSSTLDNTVVGLKALLGVADAISFPPAKAVLTIVIQICELAQGMHQDREACQDLAQHAADIARDLYRGLDTPRNPDQAMQALVEEFLRTCTDVQTAIRRNVSRSILKRLVTRVQTRDTLSRNRDKLQRGMTSLQTRLLIHMSAAITHVKSDTTRPVDISERTFKTVVDLREAGVERDGAFKLYRRDELTLVHGLRAWHGCTQNLNKLIKRKQTLALVSGSPHHVVVSVYPFGALEYARDLSLLQQAWHPYLAELLGMCHEDPRVQPFYVTRAGIRPYHDVLKDLDSFERSYFVNLSLVQLDQAIAYCRQEFPAVFKSTDHPAWEVVLFNEDGALKLDITAFRETRRFHTYVRYSPPWKGMLSDFSSSGESIDNWTIRPHDFCQSQDDLSVLQDMLEHVNLWQDVGLTLNNEEITSSTRLDSAFKGWRLGDVHHGMSGLSDGHHRPIATCPLFMDIVFTPACPNAHTHISGWLRSKTSLLSNGWTRSTSNAAAWIIAVTVEMCLNEHDTRQWLRDNGPKIAQKDSESVRSLVIGCTRQYRIVANGFETPESIPLVYCYTKLQESQPDSSLYDDHDATTAFFSLERHEDENTMREDYELQASQFFDEYASLGQNIYVTCEHADFDWVRLGAWQSALLDVIHYAEQSPTATSALVNAVEERTTMPISNFGTHNGLCRKQTEEEEEWSCEAAE